MAGSDELGTYSDGFAAAPKTYTPAETRDRIFVGMLGLIVVSSVLLAGAIAIVRYLL